MLKIISIFVLDNDNHVMNIKDKNGQSAAKLLSTDEMSEYEEGSTTISRKESTTLKKLEKAQIVFKNFSDKNLPEVRCIYFIFCKISKQIYIGQAAKFKKKNMETSFRIKA